MAVVASLTLFFNASCSSIHSVEDPKVVNDDKNVYVDLRFIKQITPQSCGAAVLASVAEYWGVSGFGQENILEQHSPGDPKKGYSIGELKRLSRSVGLLAFSFTSDREQIVKQIDLGRPLIVPLSIPRDDFLRRSVPIIPRTYSLLSKLFVKDYSHYVVIAGYNAQRVLILDPNVGFRWVKWNTFLDQWEKFGFAVLLVARGE